MRKQSSMTIEDVQSYHLSPCHPNSAGIDIGSRENYVAISPEKATELGIPIVKIFGTTTSELNDCAEYLVSCGVTDVAMESTGIYWKNLHRILILHGIAAEVVNPRHFKMVPGRKTDVSDCQWLQTLHYYGLLSGSFIPDDSTQQLRSLVRFRQKLLHEIATQVNRIQKNLVCMNVMLVNVVSDVTGKTGMGIIRAILDGHRDSKFLASLRDRRCKKSEEEIAEALNGSWRDDFLFLLRTAVETYDFLQGQLCSLDKSILAALDSIPDGDAIVVEDGIVKDRNTWEPLGPLPSDLDLSHACIEVDKIVDSVNGEILWIRPAKQEAEEGEGDSGTEGKKKAKTRSRTKNEFTCDCDLAEVINKKAGVPICDLDGFGPLTSLCMLSEVGFNLERFPDAKHFAAYLGLVPRNKITGGVIISSRTDRIKHPGSIALKTIVPSLSRMDCPLASFFHSKKASSGTGKAITATARKLAENYYNCITYGDAYIKKGEALAKQASDTKKRQRLEKLAKQLNVTISPNVLSA